MVATVPLTPCAPSRRALAWSDATQLCPQCTSCAATTARSCGRLPSRCGRRLWTTRPGSCATSLPRSSRNSSTRLRPATSTSGRLLGAALETSSASSASVCCLRSSPSCATTCAAVTTARGRASAWGSARSSAPARSASSTSTWRLSFRPSRMRCAIRARKCAKPPLWRSRRCRRRLARGLSTTSSRRCSLPSTLRTPRAAPTRCMVCARSCTTVPVTSWRTLCPS
mmetsp:Transcript_164811/g.400619  ORF Transcript_164811/g.400619 Transcript_164811/m.400619 type:complete len:226 (-) Transcript_164811:68-745(-)